MDELIEIPKKEYEELLRQQRILDALYATGVDNWEGYDQAIDTYREQKEN